MIRRLPLAIAALAIATPAQADPLTATKSVTVVSDPLGNPVPRSVPGAVADYRTTTTNPLANALKPVRNIVLVETLPDTVDLRVADLAGAGKGPVEFIDGGLLGLGASGLTYSYSAASPATDGLEFWNGTTWAYQPVADANGYDRNVRAIRVTLGSTFATSSSFQLRYRVRIR